MHFMLNINLYFTYKSRFSFYYKYKFITVKLFKPGYLLLSNYFICKNRRSVLESSFSGNISCEREHHPIIPVSFEKMIHSDCMFTYIEYLYMYISNFEVNSQFYM